MSDVDELVMWLTGVLDTALAELGEQPVHDNGMCDAPIGVHIEPEQVRARVEAERAILREHEVVSTGSTDRWAHCSTCESEPEMDAVLPCQTVRLLAYGHRHDAPGWRPEWAPEGMEVIA